MEAFKPKSVNSILNIIRVNLLGLESLQVLYPDLQGCGDVVWRLIFAYLFLFTIIFNDILLKFVYLKQTRNALEKTLECENTSMYHKLGLHWKLARQKCDDSSLMEYVSNMFSVIFLFI